VYDIAQQVQDWLASGRDVQVATVVGARGISSRDPAATAAWTPGAPPIGRLAGGLAPDRIVGTGLVEVTVADADAARAGESCGGSATILVRPASAFPDELWTRLVAREPVCLVATLPADGDGRLELFTPATIRATNEYGDAVSRLFARGTGAAAVLAGEPTRVAIALWPVPTLVVVGDGLIATALRDTAALLGWAARITPARDPALAAIEGLHRSDAVVVLSHDRAVDGPTIAAALGGRAGYIGALGARRTQAARREWLTAHGVGADDQARIHGPAGLDIDAHTPAEIAISIVAEILGSRSRSSVGELRNREGPVHVAGVRAPPPRY
jgi:xanthine dehydrogenase accessory factor